MSSGRAVVSAWAASAREAAARCVGIAARGHSRPGSVLVTGSSGKGTTCRMLAEMLRAARLHPVLTTESARTWRDLASTLIGRTARTRRGRPAIRLVEVDAAALPRAVRRTPHPVALVCTNILRGQPDDDSAGAEITAQLERAIRCLPASTTLILNADDPRAAELARDAPNPRLYFGMSDPVHGRVRADPTAEVPGCSRCGGPLSYACAYYAHLGHWACDGCGHRRPEPDVRITRIGLSRSSSTRIQVATISLKAVLDVPLPGLYNAYNALAAVTVATHLGLPAWSLRAIEGVSGPPMRMERTRVAGHDVYLAVASNATAYTEVLRAILGDGEPRRMLLGLSARRYPHQDVSWIWDVDFEALAGLVPAPVVCGSRAADLGVRLKYAGWLGDGWDGGHPAGVRIEPNPMRAVRAAIAETPPGQPLWIVSTARTLAEIRRCLTGTRLAATRPGAPRPIGPRPTGTRPPGPQPSGPPRSATQPAAPPPSRHRPDRAVRRAFDTDREPGRAGAAR